MVNKTSKQSRWGEPGRTLAELLVAMSIMLVVGVVISSVQIAGLKWYKADQTKIAGLRPARDAVDYLARDVDVAQAVYDPGDTLVIHQKKQGNAIIVTYELVGNDLQRTVQVNGGTATTRTVVSGLSLFDAAAPGGARAYIVLEGSGSGVNPGTQRLELELVSRLEVAR